MFASCLRHSYIIQHGSQSWNTPGTYTFTVPLGITSLNVDLEGPGGGGGGGAIDAVGAGAGGGGITAGISSSGNGNAYNGGYAGANTSISLKVYPNTVLGQAAIGAGGSGLSTGGGSKGTTITTTGLLSVPSGGSAGGTSPCSGVGGRGDRVYGTLNLTSQTLLTVIVGSGGGGGDGMGQDGSPYDGPYSAPGGSGANGSVSISW